MVRVEALVVSCQADILPLRIDDSYLIIIILLVGGEAGEIFFRIRVGSAVPGVLVCWGAWTAIKKDYYSHLQFKVDLNVDDLSGNLYTPSDRRVTWDDPHHKDVSTKMRICLCLIVYSYFM